MTDSLCHLPLSVSSSPEAACERFLDAIKAWTRDCLAEYEQAESINSHDQGTFVTSWVPYLQVRDDPEAQSFIFRLRDRIAHHHQQRGAWYHGYWKEQEAHHGTEHFELFLRAAWQLAPDDQDTIRQMVDATEHIGNWSAEVPDWYDWEHHVFLSVFLGTEEIDHSPPARINKPDHLRFLTLAVLSWEMTGESRYRDLAIAAGRRWAEAIAGQPILPIGLVTDGPLYDVDPEAQAFYKSFAGAAPPPENDVARAENLLASDAVNLFLSLWSLSGEAVFREATERLLEPLVTQLADPDATAVSAAVRDYRRATGDTRYDAAVLAAADQQLATPLPETIGIEPEPERDSVPIGVGKRIDMPNWLANDQPRAHNEALLALAAELRQDRELATVAVDLARTRFLLARDVYRHGRHHGCSARTVSAIARGHGRENHAGTITAVLAPVLDWLGKTASTRDPRHITNGWEIPSEGYCDQPYVVVNADGSWTATMTTGKGHEGQHGQHIVSTVSADRGRSWSPLVDIEPASGPEASWVMPLLIPETGRIYAFYTYNADDQRDVLVADGRTLSRVDTLGTYAYKYSDDGGRSWSNERYEIPMRLFECDRTNTYGGEVLFFWGVGKPFIHQGAGYVCATKVGAFGKGFFQQSEGVLYRCANLLTEPDPAKHQWETLPDGDVGMRTPEGGGPIAAEFNATPMADGSLYGTYRTRDGWACNATSRDDGRTWESGWMTFKPGGRRVKNPRGANFVRRFANGRYIYWFSFNGGDRLGREISQHRLGYTYRNPVWLCGGREIDGHIHWSQPEVLLYDDDIGSGMSYPDFFEADGEYYFTETQKAVARVHQFDKRLLEALWRQGEDRQVTQDGLLLDHTGGGSVPLPELPAFAPRQPGQRCGGLSIECWLRLDQLGQWQVVLDSRDDQGYGLLLQLTDRQTLRLTLAGPAASANGTPGTGSIQCSHTCDAGRLQTGQLHHVVFTVDAGPGIITTCIDGQLDDGGEARLFGWSRLDPHLRHCRGADTLQVADGVVICRLYDRYLLTSEAVANYHAGVD